MFEGRGPKEPDFGDVEGYRGADRPTGLVSHRPARRDDLLTLAENLLRFTNRRNNAVDFNESTT